MKLIISLLLIGHISAASILGYDFPAIQLLDDERGPGMPYLHTETKVKLGTIYSPSYSIIGCEKTTDSSLSQDDPCHHSKLAATHEGRVITNTPIYGILTQPFLDVAEPADENGNFASFATSEASMHNSFIMMSHVKYLQAGGARIIPVSYRLDKNQLNQALEQINGIYIPGDSPAVL